MDDKSRKEKTFYTVLSIVLFVLGAFTVWEFLYELCNMIGSLVCAAPWQAIVELKRMLPFIITAFTFVYMGLWCFNAYTAKSPESRAKKWKGNGTVTIILGFAIALYVVFGLIVKEYAKVIEGFVSPLFPLDIMIGGLLIAGYGIFSVIYGKKLEEEKSALPCFAKTGSAVLRGIDGFFKTFGYMIAAGSFAACIYSFYVIDWKHEYIFFNVMLWLNYFTAFAMAFVYRFIYAETREEDRKSVSKKFGLAFLFINVILFGVYLIAVEMQNEAPNLNAFGVLPIEFTASFNAFLPIYALNNIAAPIAAIIKGSVKGKKN